MGQGGAREKNPKTQEDPLLKSKTLQGKRWDHPFQSCPIWGVVTVTKLDILNICASVGMEREEGRVTHLNTGQCYQDITVR